MVFGVDLWFRYHCVFTIHALFSLFDITRMSGTTFPKSLLKGRNRAPSKPSLIFREPPKYLYRCQPVTTLLVSGKRRSWGRHRRRAGTRCLVRRPRHAGKAVGDDEQEGDQLLLGEDAARPPHRNWEEGASEEQPNQIPVEPAAAGKAGRSDDP